MSKKHDIKRIIWNNRSIEQIKCAEKMKAILENKGYKLINTDTGFYSCVLTYIK